MTALATYESTDSVVLTYDMTAQLGQTEPLSAGVKRVTMDRLERAAAGFFEPEDGFRLAIHESRKSLKRVRALLHLVRGELGDKIFDYENTHLRDTSRLISEVRTSAALADAADLTIDLYGSLLSEGTFRGLAAQLTHRRDRFELSAMEDPDLISRVVGNLERAYYRYSGWPTDPDARRVYGVGIRDSFRAIETGLMQTYTRGRTEMVAAYSSPTARNFHSWRKRAKHLRYQMEFLAPLWPEMILAMASTLSRLEALLGEDHDFAELSELIRRVPQLCPNPRERSLFFALAVQRQSELRSAAEVLGRRVYAETPDSLVGRFGEFWESRVMVNAADFESLALN